MRFMVKAAGNGINLVAGVVGMSGQDGQGAVDLLGEYDASELMRQGNSTQGKEKVGALTSGSRPAVCGANSEYEALSAVVAKAAEPSCELL